MLEVLVVIDEILMGTKNLPLKFFYPSMFFSYLPEEKDRNKNRHMIEIIIALKK